jgi:hypothetical protein
MFTYLEAPLEIKAYMCNHPLLTIVLVGGYLSFFKERVSNKSSLFCLP